MAVWGTLLSLGLLLYHRFSRTRGLENQLPNEQPATEISSRLTNVTARSSVIAGKHRIATLAILGAMVTGAFFLMLSAPTWLEPKPATDVWNVRNCVGHAQ